MITKETIKKLIIGTFVAIPFLSSLISTIHLVNLFALGNNSWMAITLAIAFEIGSIASLLILTILDRINKGMIMSIFVVLVVMQILGNLYYSFDYINQQLLVNKAWLGSFQELVGYFAQGDIVLTKLLVACLISIPIPLIGLFFLKSVVDYLKFEEPKPIEIIPEIIPPTVELNNDISFTKEIEFQPELRDVSYQKEIDFSPAFQETPNIEHQEINEIEFIEHDVVEHDIEKPKLEIIPVEYIEDIDDHKKIKPTGPSNVAIYSNNNLQ